MKSTNALNDRDLVVRFNPTTGLVSFHTISPRTGEPMMNPVHEVEWTKAAGLAGVIDIGASVCANFLARFPGEFCSEDDWEKIASDIRIATGRDEED